MSTSVWTEKIHEDLFVVKARLLVTKIRIIWVDRRRIGKVALLAIVKTVAMVLVAVLVYLAFFFGLVM